MTDDELAIVFSALADHHRIRALRFIACRGSAEAAADDEPVCACHVQDRLDLSQPATSYHMRVLRETGLVTAEKRGRWVHYRISQSGLNVLRQFLAELAEEAPAGVGVGA